MTKEQKERTAWARHELSNPSLFHEEIEQVDRVITGLLFRAFDRVYGSFCESSANDNNSQEAPKIERAIYKAMTEKREVAVQAVYDALTSSPGLKEVEV